MLTSADSKTAIRNEELVMVGLSRNLKLEWLNETARLRQENLSETELKARLTEYLSREIVSPTNLRKTREILMRLWVYDDDNKNLRDLAVKMYKDFPNAAQAIHWSLLIVTYPIFGCLSKIIGRLFELCEVITTRQIKQKLFDELGERSTLFHSTDKIIATLKDIGALTARKAGEFTFTPRIVDEEEVIALMIRSALLSDGGSYFRLSELEKLNVLYPFRYRVTLELLSDEKFFTVTNFGGEPVVMLKEIH